MRKTLCRYYHYSQVHSDGKASDLEHWRLCNIPSLPLLPGPLLSGVEVLVSIPSIGQIELFNHLTMCKQMTDVKLSLLVL